MKPGVGALTLVMALAMGAGAGESMVGGVGHGGAPATDASEHFVAPAPGGAAAAVSEASTGVLAATAPAANLPASAGIGRSLARGDILEVVAVDRPLRRDAVSVGGLVGRVSRGQRVTYLDTIDRRLRIFNVILFDGGHWVRVRAADGAEGWLEADTVREVR